MKTFGTNEYGDRDGFKIICQDCGQEAWLTINSYYEPIEGTELLQMTAEFRCSCGNHFGSTIYRNEKLIEETR
jgi:hypothetical protein